MAWIIEVGSSAGSMDWTGLAGKVQMRTGDELLPFDNCLISPFDISLLLMIIIFLDYLLKKA